MKKAIVITLIFLTFFSLPARAEENLDGMLNELKQICSNLNIQERQKDAKDRLKEENKTLRISKMLEFTNQLRAECVDSEVQSFINGTQNQEQYEKAKRFLEIIRPAQQFYQTEPSPQFNSVGVGIAVSTLIQQLNRLISPDNWACLPKISSSPIEPALKQAELLSCKPLLQINLTPVISQVELIILGLSVPYIIYFFILAWMSDNKMKRLKDLLIPYMLKLGLIFLLPTIFVIYILGTNTVTNLGFNVFNNTGEICGIDSGFACISDKMSKSIQKTDFVRLDAGMLPEPKKDKSLVEQLQTNISYQEVFVSSLWGLYYFLVFLVIGSIGLIAGSVFASSQIIIWTKTILIMLALYTITVLPSAGIKDKFEEMGRLVLASLSNLLIFNFILWLTINLVKDGPDFWKILGLLFLVAGYSGISAYYFGLLKVSFKNNKLDMSITSPSAIARNVIQKGINANKSVRERLKNNKKVFGQARAELGKTGQSIGRIASKLRFWKKK